MSLATHANTNEKQMMINWYQVAASTSATESSGCCARYLQQIHPYPPRKPGNVPRVSPDDHIPLQQHNEYYGLYSFELILESTGKGLTAFTVEQNSDGDPEPAGGGGSYLENCIFPLRVVLTLRRRYILIWMYLIARTYVSGCLSAGVDTCCSNSQWISKLLAIPFHSGRGEEEEEKEEEEETLTHCRCLLTYSWTCAISTRSLQRRCPLANLHEGP